MTFTIQYISIFIELLVAIVGIFIVFNKKKTYGWGFFTTFGIYVFYDIARLLSWNISDNILYVSFFIASLSAFWTVWEVYKRK
jgi:hypothetical protein